MKSPEEQMAEITAWMEETFSPEDEANDLIDMCRARGARIKKGQHTEKVLRELLMELVTALRAKNGSR